MASCTATLDLQICLGTTFSRVFRWESGTVIFKVITGITKAAPPIITAIGHGIPDGWRIAITNVLGMPELNAPNNPPKNSQYQKATLLSANTVAVTGVDATGFGAYISGGILWYNQPTDLAGYIARMQIREAVDSASVLLELTSTAGDIVLDNVLKTITLTIDAVDTAALTFTAGVYDLEMVSPGGVVTRLLEGAVSVIGEVTR